MNANAKKAGLSLGCILAAVFVGLPIACYRSFNSAAEQLQLKHDIEMLGIEGAPTEKMLRHLEGSLQRAELADQFDSSWIQNSWIRVNGSADFGHWRYVTALFVLEPDSTDL